MVKRRSSLRPQAEDFDFSGIAPGNVLENLAGGVSPELKNAYITAKGGTTALARLIKSDIGAVATDFKNFVSEVGENLRVGLGGDPSSTTAADVTGGVTDVTGVRDDFEGANFASAQAKIDAARANVDQSEIAASFGGRQTSDPMSALANESLIDPATMTAQMDQEAAQKAEILDEGDPALKPAIEEVEKVAREESDAERETRLGQALYFTGLGLKQFQQGVAGNQLERYGGLLTAIGGLSRFRQTDPDSAWGKAAPAFAIMGTVMNMIGQRRTAATQRQHRRNFGENLTKALAFVDRL